MHKVNIILFILMMMYVSVGYGNFLGPTNFGIGVYANETAPDAIVLGDIDNDGDIDLIVTGNDGTTQRLDKYINDGTGNFTGTNFGAGVEYSAVALGDIDNDGDLDLIVTGWDGGSGCLDKYVNDGTGNFIGPSPFGTGINTSSIVFGDIDNDGDLDFIVTGFDGVAYHLDKYINDGTGNFTGTNFGTGVCATSIALGDIDNDGDLDLIVPGNDGASYHLDKYINDGTGSFSGPIAFGTSFVGSSISFGDIDDDGDLDFIVTGYNGLSRFLNKYINDGIGNFSEVTFGTGVDYSSIALGDIDNDGDLDLMATGADDGSIKRLDQYVNDGTGNFTSTNFGMGVYMSSIALGDIDNDGDLDLIVTGQDSGTSNHLDKYINTNTIANTPPLVPTNMNATYVGGYWRLYWNQATDDWTPANMLRYKIVIGTNTSGVYDYISTNIDYPRGQANLGNVCIVTGTPFYQTKITNTKTIYWKVCAIDSAFKSSVYCAEQVATLFAPVHNITRNQAYESISNAIAVASNGDYIQVDTGTYNESIIIVNLTNLTLEATSWASNSVNTNTKIKAGNMRYVVSISNSKKVTLKGFSITSATNGVLISSAISNYIANNIIYSNAIRGILINDQNAQFNTIVSNEVYNITGGYGIRLYNTKNNCVNGNILHNNYGGGVNISISISNKIMNNKSYDNSGASYVDGIRIDGDNSKYNLISYNECYNNTYRGIMLADGVDNNTVYSNICYNNTRYGIQVYANTLNTINNIVKNNICYSNTDYSGIDIYGNNADNNIIKSNIIYGQIGASTDSAGCGIRNYQGDNNIISHNQIYNNRRGIYLLDGATGNTVGSNQVCNNSTTGIRINGDTSDNNTIESNQVYGNSTNGIVVSDGDNNLIRYNNYIHHNGKSGIYLEFTATGNIIRDNIICSNNGGFYGINLQNSSSDNSIINNQIYSNTKGVYISGDGSDNNTVASNAIYLNRGFGIQIYAADNIQIYDNKITNNYWPGILMEFYANSIGIYRNFLKKNRYGIKLKSSCISNSIYLNNIINNSNGIYITTNVGISRLDKNNIYGNSNWNLYNQGTLVYSCTNNWWGTTIASSISSTISNNGGYSNFTPYRLLGPFDITPGADTDTLPVVSWVTAYKTGASNVVIKWSNVSGSDFGYYNVYRTTNLGFTNLSSSNIIAQISNQGSVPGITFFTDTGLALGTNYYHITTVDTHPGYPNESWYSKEAAGVVNFHTLQVTKVTDAGGNFTAYSNNIVMIISIMDTSADNLKSFSVGNAGTIAQADITGVKLWFDVDKDNKLDSGEPFVANLEWDGSSLWTNNNISFSTSLSPAQQFLVTVDLALTVDENSGGFLAFIPVNSIQCSGGEQSPAGAITNSTNVSVGQFIGTAFGFPLYRNNPDGAVLGDIDNDGDLDLIIGGDDGTGHYYLHQYVNNGTGNFTGPTSIGIGVRYGSVTLGDIDNDGNLDLIVTGYDTNVVCRLEKYTNDGLGNFSGPLSVGSGRSVSSAVFGDIDNDGDLDFVIGGSDISLFHLEKYINDGTGNFAGPTSIGTGIRDVSLALGDIDNDGDLDLITTGYDGSSFHLDKYINDGTGTFSSATNIGTRVDRSSIALGDIDNDGDLDLIVSGWNGSAGVLDRYINNGNGGFTGPTSIGTGVRYSSIALGDIDNDGDLDLFVAGHDVNGIRYLDKYINDGTGTFSSGINIGISVLSPSIVLGDIDNDGDLDLIVNGEDGSGSCRLDKYKNLETTINNPPSVPAGMSADGSTGYWRLSWNQTTDDWTPADIIRYQIAIGTNTSGVYDYISTNISYPRGQANLGNVCIVTGTPYYQSSITNTKTVYWKVCAIDSAFKHSAYCSEQVAIPAGLVAYYPFNGNANDESGNNKNGTLQGTATFTNDRFGNPDSAVVLIGTGDRIEVPILFSGDRDPLTYVIWVKALKQTNTGPLYGEYNGSGRTRNCGFLSHYTGTLSYDQFDPSGGTANIYVEADNDIGVWAMYTIVKSANTVYAYKNNKYYGSASHTETFSGGAPGFAAIGSRFVTTWGGSTGTYQIHGIVDDVRIYDRALSSNEIVSLYNESGWNPPIDTNAPYITALNGPTNLVQIGNTTSITCVVEDDYSYGKVLSIEYSIDNTNSWTNCIAVGIYDSTNEAGYVIINPATLGWSIGEFHNIFFRGRDYAGNLSQITDTVVSVVAISAVTNLVANASASNEITLTWQDNNGELGYKIYINSTNNTNTATLAGTNPQDNTNYIVSSLTPNKIYYFYVRATNTSESSGFSETASNYTYGVLPKISSSKVVGNYYTNNIFLFTNQVIIGTGGISGYYYVWDKATGTSVTSSVSNWVPIGVGDVITNIAVSEGDWYLHIRSYNKANVLYYQTDYGPYKYYNNRVGTFELRKDKDRVDPDGVSYVKIENKNPILDANTGNVITDGTKFGVEVIGASVLEGVEETNGLSYVVSSNGDIHFRVKSSKVNNVKIRVYWLGDSSVYSEINVLFSYELSMEARNDAIPFNSIINPNKGEKLELYIKSEEGEHIRIKIFSIESMEEIKEMEVIGEGLTLVEWDLEISGEAIGDGYYGALIEGDGWSKEVKFYVGRWVK